MSRLAHEKLSQKAHKRFAHTGKSTDTIDTKSIPTAGCWIMIHTFYGIEKLIAKTGLR